MEGSRIRTKLCHKENVKLLKEIFDCTLNRALGWALLFGLFGFILGYILKR